MVENVKSLAELKVQLNVEERNLLSVAYKNIVGMCIYRMLDVHI